MKYAVHREALWKALPYEVWKIILSNRDVACIHCYSLIICDQWAFKR